MERLTLDKVAWVRLDAGRVLTARNHGRERFYFPGGRRESGESDEDTLIREVAEELTVDILPDTIRHYATYELTEPAGIARMTCYFADHNGIFMAGNEIDEIAWMNYADRDRTSPLDQLVFDSLHAAGHLT